MLQIPLISRPSGDPKDPGPMEGENLRKSLGKIDILGMNGWLVVTGTFGTMEFYDFPGNFPIILGISSSQLTNSIIFQRGRVKTTNQMETTDLIPRKWDLIPQKLGIKSKIFPFGNDWIPRIWCWTWIISWFIQLPVGRRNLSWGWSNMMNDKYGYNMDIIWITWGYNMNQQWGYPTFFMGI